MMMAVSKTGDK